jgi:uncharacterized membrane protein
LAAVQTHGPLLFVAVFLACTVEMVEALTIVIAVGTTRGWRWALEGAVAAVLVLAVGIAVVGPPIVHYVPIRALRGVIGIALFVVGLQWLRKAVLRAAGRKAKHDEDAIYARLVAELRVPTDAGGAAPEAGGGPASDTAPSPGGAAGPQGTGGGRDRVAVALAFKGVLLEGLEVAIIVLTLGTASHSLGLAALAAGVALVAVVAVGAVVARPLSKVPENAMKMTVGLMLVTFGTFWMGEAVGVPWPGGDLSLFLIAAGYGLVALVVVRLLARRPAALQEAGP